MTPDTTRPGPRLERLTAHEARQRLEQERNSRLSQLSALEEAGPETADPFIAAQKESVGRVLEEIDAAFARIRDRTYGTCEGCERPVPAERLEILPYVRTCVACVRRGT